MACTGNAGTTLRSYLVPALVPIEEPDIVPNKFPVWSYPLKDQGVSS